MKKSNKKYFIHSVKTLYINEKFSRLSVEELKSMLQVYKKYMAIVYALGASAYILTMDNIITNCSDLVVYNMVILKRHAVKKLGDDKIELKGDWNEPLQRLTMQHFQDIVTIYTNDDNINPLYYHNNNSEQNTIEWALNAVYIEMLNLLKNESKDIIPEYSIVAFLALPLIDYCVAKFKIKQKAFEEEWHYINNQIKNEQSRYNEKLQENK